jgi:hypothetical protein
VPTPRPTPSPTPLPHRRHNEGMRAEG